MPLKRWTKQLNGDEAMQWIWTKAQDWCDDRNLELGLVEPVKRRRFQPTDRYRRRTTVVFKSEYDGDEFDKKES